jgi:RNA polymerase sigma-70 factor (ECF subfamily)
MSRPDHGALFAEHRSYLIGLAYRMLGSVAEAEDAVQEAFLRSQQVSMDGVESPRAYLATIVTRICLDQLKSARARRERYTGPWLPEPVRTDLGDAVAKPAVRAEVESLSLAFLVVLETLSPLERAAFLLHDVFDYTHAEVAGILQRDVQAVRQLLHRARAHVRDGRPRFEPDPEHHRTLLLRFLGAAQQGDLAALESMLASEVVLKNDGGGKVHSALKPVRGANRVARWVLGVKRKSPPTHPEIAEINGQPGILLRGEHGLVAVMTFVIDESGRIREIDTVVNPEKLTWAAGGDVGLA